MTFTQDNKTDLIIYNLNTIQSIITRVSNIGYTIIGLDITMCSIFLPLMFTIKAAKNIKCIIGSILLLMQIILRISYLINLRNEKAWRSLYNSKINTIISNKEFELKSFLKLEFDQEKKKLKTIDIFKSWTSLLWISLIVLNIIFNGLIYVI